MFNEVINQMRCRVIFWQEYLQYNIFLQPEKSPTAGHSTVVKTSINSIILSALAGKRGVLKRPWSEAERAAVEEHLTQNITELRVPAKADCERCLQQCPLLVSNHRDWRAIKFYCHNRIQLLKKNQRRESEPLPLTVCWEGGVIGGGRCVVQLIRADSQMVPCCPGNALILRRQS